VPPVQLGLHNALCCLLNGFDEGAMVNNVRQQRYRD